MTLLANSGGSLDRIERRERSCAACNGTGTDYQGSDEYWQALPCPHCGGSGVEIERRELPPPEEEEC